MNTATIYASYGVLAHEYEIVWGLAPDATAGAWDEMTVRLPEGYTFEESIYGEPLVEDDDTDLCSPLSMVLAKVTDDPDKPFLRVPYGDSWRKVPLTVVSVDADEVGQREEGDR